MGLRIGVVGTGYWADEVHAAGVAGHPDTELVGVWGRDFQKAQLVAAKRGCEGFDDFDALLTEVDAVTFAVPPMVQSELALRAIRSEKHVVLEKPIATSLKAANALAEATVAHDVAGVVFFTERFVPSRERWLQAQLGAELLGGRASWLASLQTPDNPFANSPWREADGALWDVGPHALSLLLPVLGPVVDIAAHRGRGDLVAAVLTHQHGATSVMELSLTMPPGATRFEFEIYDASGWRSRPPGDFVVVEAYQAAVSDLINNVRDGRREHRCDIGFGRDVVETLHRLEQIIGPPLIT